MSQYPHWFDDPCSPSYALGRHFNVHPKHWHQPFRIALIKKLITELEISALVAFRLPQPNETTELFEISQNSMVLVEPEKEELALQVVKGLAIQPASLLLKVLGKDIRYQSMRSGFYRSNASIQLLNLVKQNSPSQSAVGVWLRDYSLSTVLKKVSEEADAAKAAMNMKVSDLTAEFLKNFNIEEDISAVLREKAPLTRAILDTAAQTKRAAKENVKKKPDTVRAYMLLC